MTAIVALFLFSFSLKASIPKGFPPRAITVFWRKYGHTSMQAFSHFHVHFQVRKSCSLIRHHWRDILSGELFGFGLLAYGYVLEIKVEEVRFSGQQEAELFRTEGTVVIGSGWKDHTHIFLCIYLDQ